MKIELASFTGDSGLADYAVSLARALQKITYVRVVTSDRVPAFYKDLGFEIISVFRRTRHLPFDLVRYIHGTLNRRPDWIVLQGPLKWPLLDSLVVGFLRLRGIRVAITVHDVLPHYPGFFSRWTFPFYYQSADRLIAHSDAAKSMLHSMGVRKPILVVPHGIYDLFKLTNLNRDDARKLLELPTDRHISLFFGHLETRKGLAAFIDAAASMKNDQRHFFVIAGGRDNNDKSSDYQQLLARAATLPNTMLVDQRIPFEDVEKYFVAADAVALPYLEGTTSGVLKLALAFGVPVVATRVGDFPEQVPKGAGFFVSPDEDLVTNLIKGLQALQSDPSYSLAMSNSRDLAQWSDISTKYLDFLKS